MNNPAVDDDLMRRARSEYMRRYRASKGGLLDSDRVTHRARNAAAKWVRHNRPELWQQLLDEAWKTIRP